MICERCGSKGRKIRTHVLRVIYESGNGFVYNLCSDCVRDIERFIKEEPRFNAFGYNLDFEKNCEEVYKKGGMSMTREEAIRDIEECVLPHVGGISLRMAIEDMKEMDRLSKATPVLKEPERPHGDWEKYGDKIEAYDIAGHKTWGQKRRCTKCGFIKTYIEDFGFYPFCPNCSALMWKEGEENE